MKEKPMQLLADSFDPIDDFFPRFSIWWGSQAIILGPIKRRVVLDIF